MAGLTRAGLARLAPGLGAAAVAVLAAWLVHLAIPAVPWLTAAVVLGIVIGQLPRAQAAFDGALAPGIRFSAKSLMRTGVVLLGLKLSLVDIADLGFVAIAAIVALVIVTFFGTWALGLLMRLPGGQPLLIAAGFSICGASAIGAMSSATRSRPAEQATPVALVTLCGTLAIAVLPALRAPLGLSDEEFGHWVGASVHDVGQVVATAQTAGSAALAIAVVVKLTRVLMLAPMVTVTALVIRLREAGSTSTGEAGRARQAGQSGQAEQSGQSGSSGEASARPKLPIMPLFVAGFIAAVLANSFLPIPAVLLETADVLQTIVLAAALFALGSTVRLRSLVRTGWRALIVGLSSWLLIAALALIAIRL